MTFQGYQNAPNMAFNNNPAPVNYGGLNNNWNNNAQQQNLQKIQQMQQERQNQKPESDPFAMFLNPGSTNNTDAGIPTLQPPPPSRSRGRSRPTENANNLFF
jgi:hypothetical protein